MIRLVVAALVGIRAAYARWAMQYVPPTEDFYMTLSRWVEDDRLEAFLKGE